MMIRHLLHAALLLLACASGATAQAPQCPGR